MSTMDALTLLERAGALIRNSHIVYTSGRHGREYVNKDAVYPHTEMTSELCRMMAEPWRGQGVTAVVGPALGGIILSQWVAHHLSRMEGKEVAGVYAEKNESEDGFVIRRGYDKFLKGQRVLVVEDVITTGMSVARAVEAARAVGAQVVGVAALCNRGGISAKDLGDVPKLSALVEVKLDSWDAEECPLCKASKPVNTSVGKGAQFLKDSSKR